MTNDQLVMGGRLQKSLLNPRAISEMHTILMRAKIVGDGNADGQ